MGQEVAVLEQRCCKERGWGGNGAGLLMEKLRNRVGFRSSPCRLWLRRQAGGIPKLKCPGPVSLHCWSSNVASKPSTDSSSTCHQPRW